MRKFVGAVKQVEVGPFLLADLDQREVVDHIVEMGVVKGSSRVVTAFALHVEGLNQRANAPFVEAMRNADIVYPDGGSVVWLARRAGAQRVERAPTTDIGWDVLRGMAERLERLPRVALIGGPPGLAGDAGAALAEAGAAEVVSVSHGYHRHWEGHLARVRAAEPDVTLVGLGVPLEMLWVDRWRTALPPCLVLTCGGWFGFLSGQERRAPAPLRRSGLEWTARLAQSPSRLGARYVKGAVSTAALARSTYAPVG